MFVLKNSVNLGTLVEASKSLGYHWNERETLPVAIVCHPPGLPLVSESQREAGLLGFSGNSSVLKRVDDSDIQDSIKTRVPMGWGMRMSAGILSTSALGARTSPLFWGLGLPTQLCRRVRHGWHCGD